MSDELEKLLEQVHQGITVFDFDENGSISAKELGEVLKALG